MKIRKDTILRRLAALLLVATAAFASPTTAFADFKVIAEENYGAWGVTFELAEKDGTGICGMRAEWSKGLSFALMSYLQSTVTLQLVHPDWKIPKNTRRPVKLRIDDNFVTNAIMEQVTPQAMGAFQFHEDKSYWPFVDAATKGKLLTIELPDGSRYSASLNKSSDALRRFTQCTNEWSGMNVSGRSPPLGAVAKSAATSNDTPRTVTSSIKTPPKKERVEAAPAESSGSGLVVSASGHIVTNRHVVDKCTNIKIMKVGDLPVPAQLMAVSKTDDIALLKAPISGPAASLLVGPGVRQGSIVHVYGFPLSGALSVTGNFTSGSVAAMAGLNNDSRFYQITAPVQPGNSGGPLIDSSGLAVGLVTSKLNAIAVAKYTGDIPQNINFALKGSMIGNFLDAQGVAYGTSSARPDRQAADIAELARGYTVHITCTN